MDKGERIKGKGRRSMTINEAFVVTLLRIVGRAVPTSALIVFFLSLLLTTPALAQETSLIDILKAKGVLSQEDIQKLRASSGKGGTAEDDQAVLIGLLKAKGILNDQDLAQLKSPAVAPSDVNERLMRIETQQKTQTEQQDKAVEELKKTTVADVKKSID
jgi:hypothetical protein